MILCILPVVLFLIFTISLSLFSEIEYLNTYGMIEDGNKIQEYARIKLFPQEVSFHQYKTVLFDTSDFLYYFWNSVLISIPGVIGLIGVSFFGGYAFAKFNFPGKRILFYCMILIVMIPYQIMLAPQLMFLNKVNLVNTRLSVILPNIFSPFGTYLIYQFMLNIPDDCLEAAKVDGAGQFRILVHIVLPQAKSGIISLIILNLIDTWNIVEQPLIFIQNKFKYPLSIILSETDGSITNNVFACCVIFLVPLILTLLICKENLIEGIQKSMIKKGDIK